jgi:hypothetical protein
VELVFVTLGINAVGLAGLLLARGRRKPVVAEAEPTFDAYNPEVAAWLAGVRNGGR